MTGLITILLIFMVIVVPSLPCDETEPDTDNTMQLTPGSAVGRAVVIVYHGAPGMVYVMLFPVDVYNLPERVTGPVDPDTHVAIVKYLGHKSAGPLM